MSSYFAKPPKGCRLLRRESAASGLLGAWLLNEKGGLTAYDAVQGKKNDGAFTAGPTWTMGPHGPAVLMASASNQYIATGYKQSATTGALAALVRSDTVARMHVASINYDGSSVALDLNLGGEGSFTLDGFGFYNGTWRKSLINTDIRGDGKWHFVGGDFDGTTLRFVLDGNVDRSTAYTGTIPTTNANGLDVGGYRNDGIYFNGAIGLVLAWNRALTVKEWKDLAADPFRMFRRRSVPVPLAATSPPPPPTDSYKVISGQGGGRLIRGAPAITY